MLRNERYNAALSSSSRYFDSRQAFLDSQYMTQRALDSIGYNREAEPRVMHKVDRIFMDLERIPNLRVPFGIEILGMPGAGKTSMINRYLEELWTDDRRHEVGFVLEGADQIKDEHNDLKKTNPFTYSSLAGMQNFVSQIRTLKNVNSGMKSILSDRGQVDRRVFRRTLSLTGDVDPSIMLDESQWSQDLENSPIQTGGLIMMMVRPETTYDRRESGGQIVNSNFLPQLYEQYWRLYYDILTGELPYGLYTCIDAEKSTEDVYSQFKYAVDSALRMHSTYLAALARAFPDLYDAVVTEREQNPRGQHPAEILLGKLLGGKRVRIVGGDEMIDKWEVFNKAVLEGIELT